ncbi:retrovirus-related pol polyprotein from transposon TNT 1-94 [Tanacetum coccineum]
MLSEQVPSNIVKALGGRGRRKEKISTKGVVFTKGDKSSSMPAPEITSNSESECDTQELLPPFPKLIGAEPTNTSNSLISLADLTSKWFHNKYALVIVDEYSRYTWVFCLAKKSDAADCIMSFIRQMENLNEVRVKEIRSDNGTYGVAERRNRTLIEAARTMLNSAQVPKQFWGEIVNTACYTQNRSIIMKRYGKTAYEVFRGRSHDISYFYVFGYPVHIHNHRDHLGKFDEKADDGFFLGYSPLAKAFKGFVSPKEPLEFTNIDDHPTSNEDDHPVSADNPEPTKIQEDVISETLVGIITRSRIRDLEAASAHECLYINFLSEVEPKKLIEALEEEGWMDVKSAFLNGKVLEEVYVQQPLGFESSEFPNYVWKLDKALYGLKQALRAWYENLLKFLIKHKFVRGFQIKQDFKGILIFQEKYVKDLLKKYDLADSVSVECPMLPPNNLGPDESGVSVNETLFRGMLGYQANPKESHLVDVKRISSFLKGTPNLGLWYPKGSGFDLKAYSDSDYAGCNLDRKTTSGSCQILGGKLVCWSAKKQRSVVMSSAEAKYVASIGCCAQVLWIKSQLAEFKVLYDKVSIFYDNTSVIAISNNPVLHSRTKHIDIRPSENYVSVPPKETVKAGLTTLGLIDEKNPSLSSSDLINLSQLRVKYFSSKWRVLM